MSQETGICEKYIFSFPATRTVFALQQRSQLPRCLLAVVHPLEKD
jgi:hypothetical protein